MLTDTVRADTLPVALAFMLLVTPDVLLSGMDLGTSAAATVTEEVGGGVGVGVGEGVGVGLGVGVGEGVGVGVGLGLGVGEGEGVGVGLGLGVGVVAVAEPKISKVASVSVPPLVLPVPLSSLIFSRQVPLAFSPQLRTVIKVQLAKLSPESLCTSAKRLTVPDGEVRVILRLPRAV